MHYSLCIDSEVRHGKDTGSVFFRNGKHEEDGEKNWPTESGRTSFEIKPAVPYTEADLNWQDKQSRTSIETDDASSRPEIAEKLADMDHDRIFLGFPIWWYSGALHHQYLSRAVRYERKDHHSLCHFRQQPDGDTNAHLALRRPARHWLKWKRFDHGVSEQ